MKGRYSNLMACITGWLITGILYLPNAGAESISTNAAATNQTVQLIYAPGSTIVPTNNVQVIVLTQEEYESIAPTIPEDAVISVNVISDEPTTTQDTHMPPPLQSSQRKSSSPDGYVDGLIDQLIVDVFTADWGKADTAIVIFIVIGLVVTVAVVAYTGYYAYHLLTGGAHDNYWFSADLKSTLLVGSGTSGHASGIKLGLGFENRHRRVGALIETGYLDMTIRPKDTDTTIRPSGAYALAGAGIRWMFDDRVNPSWLGMELLAGTATDKNVKLMSVARATLNLAIGSRGRVGFTVGAMSMGLDIDEGILQNRNQFSTLLGLETGFRF